MAPSLNFRYKPSLDWAGQMIGRLDSKVLGPALILYCVVLFARPLLAQSVTMGNYKTLKGPVLQVQ